MKCGLDQGDHFGGKIYGFGALLTELGFCKAMGNFFLRIVFFWLMLCCWDLEPGEIGPFVDVGY
jgi:hypothetical protein